MANVKEFIDRVKYGDPASRTAQADTPRRPAMQRPGFPALTDPNNPHAALSEDDLADPPAKEPESESDIAIVSMVKSGFNASATQRWIHEREWILCSGFDRGNHYVPWRDATNYPDLLIDPDDPERSWYTANLIGNTVVKKLKARLTMSKPTAFTKPWTMKPIDVAAAAEGRDILAHYDQHFDRSVQTGEIVDIALTTSTAFLKVIWDPFEEAWTAYTDKTGNQRVAKARIGEIGEYVCPPFEIYCDPSARCWEQVQWIIHAKRYPLEYFQKRFGEKGWQVKAEAYSAATSLAGWWEQRMDQIAGEAYRTTAERYADKSATLFEYHERPTLRFPGGRLIYCSDGVLLAPVTALPYKSPSAQNVFPFVPYSFCNKFGSLWGLNAVHDLIGSQRNINQIGSRIFDRIDTEKPMWMKPTGSNITADNLQARSSYNIVEYDLGQPPTVYVPPPINEAWFSGVGWFEKMMMDISGVHEVSKAEASPNVDSGIMVELLQEQDTTQIAEAHENLEKFAKWRGEWEISLASQNYKEPRLITISQSSDPNTAAMNVRSFEALSGGGRCSVCVQPGSSISKSPAARMAWWMDLMKSGGFNIQMMPMLLIGSKLMGFEQADIKDEQIQWAMQQMLQMEKALQPDPQQQAQAQMQAQLTLENAKGQIALKIAQMKSTMDLQADMMRARIDGQFNLQQEQNKTAADVMIEREKLHGAMMLEHQKSFDKMFDDMHEFVAKMHLQELAGSQPSISLTAKAGSGGTIGIEKKAQLPQVDDAGEIKQMNKPKPMTSAGGAPSG